MNLLYVCQRVPYPPNRGDKIASFNAVCHLARSHRVFIAALADSEEEHENARKIEKLGFTIDVATIPSWRAKVNAVRALATGTPLSVAYFRSAELAAKIRRRVSEDAIDAFVVFSSSMGQYYDPDFNIPLVADFVDLDSRKWDLYASCHGWPRSWIYRTEERRLLAWEKSLAQEARCSLVRTEAERDDCARLIPGARFEVLSNGVDLEYFDARAIAPREDAGPKDLVFTGVMDYFPNIQGVKYFATEILPLVQREHPEATFTIAGARPHRDVLRLGEIPGVTVVGPQPDLRPFIGGARVAVVPLLLARGIQNKVLEAMAMSVPVVLTPAAYRGVEADEGEGVLVGDSAESFAARVCSLLADPQHAAQVGRRGRERVESRYVWGQQLRRLEEILDEVTGTARSEGCVAARGGEK